MSMTRMKIICSFSWFIVLSEKNRLQVCRKWAETYVTVIMKHPIRSATTDKHLSQAPKDHRCSMKFTISRSDKCFHWLFWTVDTQFPFSVEFGWIPFFYQITISRGLAQLHDKVSTQHPQLTANEKSQTEVFFMPKNGGFPCSIDGARADAARRSPGGQGKGQTAMRTPHG